MLVESILYYFSRDFTLENSLFFKNHTSIFLWYDRILYTYTILSRNAEFILKLNYFSLQSY